MTTLTGDKRPTYSPWAEIQTCHKYAEGIYQVTAPGHGGFMVSLDVARATLSKPAQDRGDRYNGWLCYEEDCDWAILAWERHDLWPRLFEYFRKEQSKGIDVCNGRYGDDCGNPVEGIVDGFGYCAAHESHVRTNRQMANDPESYLRFSLSLSNAQFLLDRDDAVDPEGYAIWLKHRERDRLRAERNPDCTVAALRMTDTVTKVWTADDKVHYVTAESYGSGGVKADHRLSNMVLVGYSES